MHSDVICDEANSIPTAALRKIYHATILAKLHGACLVDLLKLKGQATYRNVHSYSVASVLAYACHIKERLKTVKLLTTNFSTEY
jgi:hypothetical protein